MIHHDVSYLLEEAGSVLNAAQRGCQKCNICEDQRETSHILIDDTKGSDIAPLDDQRQINW